MSDVSEELGRYIAEAHRRLSGLVEHAPGDATFDLGIGEAFCDECIIEIRFSVDEVDAVLRVLLSDLRSGHVTIEGECRRVVRLAVHGATGEVPHG